MADHDSTRRAFENLDALMSIEPENATPRVTTATYPTPQEIARRIRQREADGMESEDEYAWAAMDEEMIWW